MSPVTPVVIPNPVLSATSIFDPAPDVPDDPAIPDDPLDPLDPDVP